MFERLHHRHIAQVLESLDGPLLKENQCLFGGGTAIALRYGEFRESVDIDFLVSDLPGYRNLRSLLTGPRGVLALAPEGAVAFEQVGDVRADQYGIRTQLAVADQRIKFEIVLEGRILLAAPGVDDEVCGIALLTPLDMMTSKLLANSDRWMDDGVFSRDLIDLAMMTPALGLLRQAITKAEGAYGESILLDLEKAIDRMQTRRGWLERCMEAMAMTMPKAELWQKIRRLRRVLP
ncbi:nucleotidyl transferase AbiEii/AbiGii toxin family protein [Aromatoleum buckelii]|uniref:Nucleotidyl transferase AbiEii/AbiGii toxin family protein n=2 Tax=Aromatoleum buckelii TaxID=200254 RepID=A0ABX1N6J6_9RHOO|nr:nucleotidyl transferase AbiEii/AbiGii toxin family protein [Aromatoleum buckelii]MCK0512739.1 nucleotidyl transferase AbiEii/AbiGii toxin family protein [Aromatoleum buckelii]